MERWVVHVKEIARIILGFFALGRGIVRFKLSAITFGAGILGLGFVAKLTISPAGRVFANVAFSGPDLVATIGLIVILLAFLGANVWAVKQTEKRTALAMRLASDPATPPEARKAFLDMCR